MALMYLTSQYLTYHVPEWLPLRNAFGDVPSALPFALAVHFNGWAWQFFGHFKFEGRAPALFDNLTQGEWDEKVLGREGGTRGINSLCCHLLSRPSVDCPPINASALVTAPFFVHIEALFALFNCA
jgi:uncharacterized membrane protein YGL010W